jgi:hypothetical protein
MLTVRRVFGTIFQPELSFRLLTASAVIGPIYSPMCLFGMLKAHGELGPFTAQHILRVGRGEEAERRWQGGDTRRARSCWRGLKTLAPPGEGRDTSRTQMKILCSHFTLGLHLRGTKGRCFERCNDENAPCTTQNHG